jgi:hypothetical protein
MGFSQIFADVDHRFPQKKDKICENLRLTSAKICERTPRGNTQLKQADKVKKKTL